MLQILQVSLEEHTNDPQDSSCVLKIVLTCLLVESTQILHRQSRPQILKPCIQVEDNHIRWLSESVLWHWGLSVGICELQLSICSNCQSFNTIYEGHPLTVPVKIIPRCSCVCAGGTNKVQALQSNQLLYQTSLVSKPTYLHYRFLQLIFAPCRPTNWPGNVARHDGTLPMWLYQSSEKSHPRPQTSHVLLHVLNTSNQSSFFLLSMDHL